MTTSKLTTKSIKAMVYKGQVYERHGRTVETRDVRWDADVPGFGLRLYISGGKTFVFSYRSRGRKRLMTLGRFGADLTLDQARRRARKRRVEVQDGADPLEERRKTARGETLGDLMTAYILVEGELDIERGIELAEGVVGQQPIDQTYFSSSYALTTDHVLGLAYMKQGEYAKGMEFLEKSAVKAPNNWRIKEDLEEARKKLQGK